MSISGIIFTEVTSSKNSVQRKKRNEGHKQIVPNTKGIVNVLSCNLNFVYKRFSIRSCENTCSLRLKTMGIEWSSSSKKKKKKSISTAWHGPDPHLKIRLLYTAYYFIDLTSELLLFFERNGLNTGTKNVPVPSCGSPFIILSNCSELPFCEAGVTKCSFHHLSRKQCLEKYPASTKNAKMWWLQLLIILMSLAQGSHCKENIKL